MSVPMILIVDDEPSIRRSMATLLRSRGYAVVTASTGHEGLQAFTANPIAMAIVDLGLPDMDGRQVCREIRDRADVPILVLSVRQEERLKVAALDAGADDYVTKPFGAEELLARIRASLRRGASADSQRHGQLVRAGLTIDYDTRRVRRDGAEIRLTPKEFDLLTLLVRNRDRVLTHRAILKAIWGPNAVEQPEHLWTLVAQLRKKIEPDPAHPKYLLSEPWVGYRFATDQP